MDIYENIIIGNFVFSLGVAFGQLVGNAESPPAAVNLLQQTPLDTQLGDVLLQGVGVMRLIEFKREGNRSDKEVAKLAHLRRNLELPENVDLKILSSHVHWYIETKNQGVLVTKICPYLHFLHTRDRGPSLLDFCSELARELLRPGDPALSPLFERYLQCLSKSQGEPASGSGGMMLYTDGSGSLKYVVVDDLRQLVAPFVRHGYMTPRRTRGSAQA